MARRRWGRGPAGGVRLGTAKGGGGRPDLVVEAAAGGEAHGIERGRWGSSRRARGSGAGGAR